jgi:hypothetical protein
MFQDFVRFHDDLRDGYDLGDCMVAKFTHESDHILGILVLAKTAVLLAFGNDEMQEVGRKPVGDGDLYTHTFGIGFQELFALLRLLGDVFFIIEADIAADGLEFIHLVHDAFGLVEIKNWIISNSIFAGVNFVENPAFQPITFETMVKPLKSNL